MDLFHLVSWPREQAAAPHPCLVLLHGRGSDEQDLFSLVPELPRRPLVVSVRAPFPFPWGGFFWYDLTNNQPKPDVQTMSRSLDELREFIAALPSRYQVDPAQVYVLGFSQGSLMSGCLTLANPELIAGTVMLSGYLPAETGTGDVTGKPVFMAHGSNDGVLPVVLGRQARLFLEGRGASVDYHEYAMDHQIIPDELRAVRRWFEMLGIQ